MRNRPDLDLALIQTTLAWHDPVANREHFQKLLEQARGADLVILPEMFSTGFSMESAELAEPEDGPSSVWLREQAQRLGAAVTGSVQIRDDGGEAGKVFNRLLWATPDGDFAYYDKRHLFRMAREHERYAAGRDRLTVAWKGWRICPLVCYDLRFPVFIRNRFDVEAADRFDYDLLVFVANWPAARRHAWRTLLRARAIENLACVAAVNRAGRDGNRLDYAGDSVALDPLGEVLVECDARPQVARSVFSAEGLRSHRERFPAQLDADRFELLG